MARLTIPTKLSVLVLLLLLGSPHLLRAQTVDLDKDRLPVASLNTLWRFHTGDDPAWASPKFDDSAWSLLRPDRSWADQGYLGYEGFAWYRFQLLVPPGLTDISINPPSMIGAYEVYADGTITGSYGRMPPNFQLWTPNRYLTYKVPSPVVLPSGVSRKVVVAIRVYFRNTSLTVLDGGPTGDYGLLAGNSSQIMQSLKLNISTRHWLLTSPAVLGLLRTLTAIATLALFVLRRKDFEYLWFSLTMFCAGIHTWLYLYIAFYSISSFQYSLWLQTIGLVTTLTILGFYQQLLRPRLGWLFRLAVLSVFLEFLYVLQKSFLPDLLVMTFSDLLGALLGMQFYVWVLAALFNAARNKSVSDSRWMDARLLLVPVLLDTLMFFWRAVSDLVWNLGNLRGIPVTVSFRIVEKPFPIEIGQATEALWLLGVFAVLVLRFARTRSEQERYATEVEGARAVQQFLIPEDLPTIPGLVIECDYRPAREVGGDFFQIIPNPEDDSALIFVGDVAGKGMQAGMLATLLVGALRTAATFTRDPAVILGTLNNRLCGKGNATALALRIEPDGAATLVNAGHLPPYLNGIELPMEGALPLGTIPNLDFPILHFQINPGDTLTLISDGILEAQKPDGELFGFDRITKLLEQHATAASLASAAQSFGQSDDITVLTLSRPVGA